MNQTDKPSVPVDLKDLDFTLLRKQKARIVQMVANACQRVDDHDALEGIIHLLDNIQDQAAKTLGETAVFGEIDIENQIVRTKIASILECLKPYQTKADALFDPDSAYIAERTPVSRRVYIKEGTATFDDDERFVIFANGRWYTVLSVSDDNGNEYFFYDKDEYGQLENS